MNVLVTASQRVQITPDGKVWTKISSQAYPFWSRYLDVFDTVYAGLRPSHVQEPDEGSVEVTGPGVALARPPALLTHSERFPVTLATVPMLRDYLARPLALIMRVPCPVGTFAWRLRGRDRPFGVEVVGDPYESLAPGASTHSWPVQFFGRPAMVWATKQECRTATAVSYVTAEALQRRYPPGPNALSTHYSSTRLTDDDLAAAPRSWDEPPTPAKLVFVGAVDQLYKAPDVLLEAVASAVRTGRDLQLTLVGGGGQQPMLERMASDLGIRERVRFTGQVASRERIIELLDEADLFVLPSRQEGLPRAVIEAMARGLPSISSTVGGIPELLEPNELVEPDDVEGLAKTILAMVDDSERMTAASERNLERARDYHEDVLRARRRSMYQHVERATRDWLRARGR